MSENKIVDELYEIRRIEEKWQKKWEEEKIFEADPKPGQKKFFITVPYPYTSGPLHIGHGRTFTIGDVVARYKRLRGYHVLFPMAFHITGTPIASISDRIKEGDEKAIEMYRKYILRYENDPKKAEEILKTFVDPFNVATYFANKIQVDFKALGFSIDWRRRFHTGEPYYNRFVEWQYHKLREKGYLARGSHKVTYCLYHKQPEGEDDIKDADVNPVKIVEFVGIKFKFDDGYIVAATLRPETIYGATNLWANPEATYVKFKWKGEILYMSKEAVVKFEHQYEKVEILGEYKGDYFIGKKAVSPLGSELYILPAVFVDPDNATGFVYSEPSDAPFDYVALMDLKKNKEILIKYGVDPSIVDKIEPIKIMKVPGIDDHHAKVVVEKLGVKNQKEFDKLEEATKEVYKEQYYNAIMLENTGEFAGMKVSEAKDKIKNKLLKEGKAILFYETSRKAECRAGGKIIVATIKDQWFLDYSKEEWKERTREWIEKMWIYPEKYKKLFLDTVDWLDKRPCARKRGIGTKLPFDREWIIESLSDSTIYMAFYTIIHHIRRLGLDPKKLDPSFFDYVFLGKGDVEKVSDLTGVPVEELENMRTEFLYWYPNDQRHTAIAHITNHLTFFIMHHIAIFPQEHWPRAITLNNMVIKEGMKMSKSKGNVVFLRDIAEKYSADLFRLYAVFSTDLDGVLDWREKDVTDLRKQFLRLFSYLKRVANSKIADDRVLNTGAARWFISRFNERIKKVTDSMENMKLRDATIELIYSMMSDIAHLEKRLGRDNADSVVRKIVDKWVIMLSPIIPHISEEIWALLGQEGYVSLAQWPEYQEALTDKKAELKEQAIIDLYSDVSEIIKLVKKKPSKIKLILAADWKRKLYEKLIEAFGESSLNMSSAMKVAMSDQEIRKFGKQVQQIVQKIVKNRKLLPPVIITKDDEIETFSEAREFLENEFGCKVEIVEEESVEDPNEVKKAKQSLPLKPGIIIY